MNPPTGNCAPVKQGLEAPIPYSLTPAADALSRQVMVSVLGRPVVVDCPSWCVAAHDETLVTLEDLGHEGERVSLAAPTYSAGTPRDTEVLVANIAQYPFSRGTDAEPHLVLDATSDGETAELGVTRVLAFLDQMAAHAARIRRQVGILQAAEPEPQHERADDNPDQLPPLPQRVPGESL